ncbi:thiamine phosphate synthase [Hydrogenimonas sp.]
MTPLYALLDAASLERRGWSLERFVDRAHRLGAEMLQYRDKSGDLERVRIRLESLVSLFEGKVIVNDYPELAYLCDGVHVGQEDLRRYAKDPSRAVETLRDMVGEERWIGLSTHNADEVLEANGLPIEYIGLGAYRNTSTKKEARVLERKAFSEVAALSKHPVAAIGGVRPDDTIPHVRWNVVGSAIYED